MKKSMIQVGKIYWDQKKGLRKVCAISVDDFDQVCVDYAEISGSRKRASNQTDADGNPIFGCYLYSFQEWAKEIVTFGAETLEFARFFESWKKR